MGASEVFYCALDCKLWARLYEDLRPQRGFLWRKSRRESFQKNICHSVSAERKGSVVRLDAFKEKMESAE